MNLTLGTAMWGWTVPPETCFELLNHFYVNGFRQIDTATNYPINKQPEDFRKSENILLEWIKMHGVQDLETIVKIGSINNLRSPAHNLNKSFILMNLDDYHHKYGSNFTMLMIHWDNRNEENEILQTLEALDEARKLGLAIGLSGIQYPKIYCKLNKEFQFGFHIQFKHNLLQSDYARYQVFHGKRRFTTYGINAGGIKLDATEYNLESSLRARGGNIEAEHPIVTPLREILAKANQVKNRPKLLNMNQIGMLYAYHSPDIESILIGPSKLAQLQDTLEFFQSLQHFDYSEVYQELKQLTK
jgi:aryl-alcohol dehydrogenase-like predicted oxidoreductase